MAGPTVSHTVETALYLDPWEHHHLLQEQEIFTPPKHFSNKRVQSKQANKTPTNQTGKHKHTKPTPTKTSQELVSLASKMLTTLRECPALHLRRPS